MVIYMQRYFISTEYIKGDFAIIEGKDYHHIKDVMRMRVGDRIILLDNMLNEYLCEITDLTQRVSLNVLNVSLNNNELSSKVTIAQGLVHKNKIEEVVRRLVELGGNSYINVIMERCNIKLKSKDDYKLSRLETIVKEASEQSERGKLLELSGIKTFKEFIKYSNEFDYKFVCYEETGRENSNSIYKYANDLTNKNILVLVGPEGGISKTEIDILKENGFILIGLGKRILRTETAPLMVMSILSSLLDYEGDSNE